MTSPLRHSPADRLAIAEKALREILGQLDAAPYRTPIMQRVDQIARDAAKAMALR